MATKSEEMVKVQFYDPDVGYENLWATPLGGDRYCLESVPFFIYGVSAHDIVQALPSPEGRLQFVSVVRPSERKTLRVRPDQFTIEHERGKDVIQQLEALGCSVELKPPRLIAVDIPGEVEMAKVTTFPSTSGVPWEYANPKWEEVNQKRRS